MRGTLSFLLTADLVQHKSKSALFPCGVVFVYNAVRNGLIYFLYSVLVQTLSQSRIAGIYGSLVFFKRSFQRAFEHFVLHSLLLAYLYALFS